jgi:hypothetical protein
MRQVNGRLDSLRIAGPQVFASTQQQLPGNNRHGSHPGIDVRD